MSSFGNGRCVRCLSAGQACWRNRRICVNEGQFCSNRGFAKCCDELICEKDGPRSGKCVRCLSSGKRCFSDSKCCSKNCVWLRCK
ncbi:unnamed protein product [Schistocephalus solidus]|uniref:UPF0506 domain-containing protein n=1 Tax=Schistocephalus solidus TaxID=70667 RepID=A0A3P7CU93_SCHSO|nr:unnamed protein product [Schistocephalus solidus]